MHIIKKKLDRMAADNRLLPKTEKYEAVHYMLNEWDALMNIFILKRRLPSGQQSCGTTQQIHIIIPKKLTFLRVAYWCQAGSHVLFVGMLMQTARC